MKSKLILEGVFTHFATVDDFVDIQFKRLKSFVKLCYKYKLYPIVHADNSAVNERFNHKLNMGRVGYNLFIKNNEIFPVVEIKSRIVEIQEVKKNESIGYGNKCIAGKNTKVAIIPIGYADGFDMGYIGIQLKIKNQLCRVLNVCMDCFMLDISNVKLKKGDDIYVLNKFNSLKYYANYDKTHEYEIITRFSHARATRKLVVSVSSYRHNIQ